MSWECRLLQQRRSDFLTERVNEIQIIHMGVYRRIAVHIDN